MTLWNLHFANINTTNIMLMFALTMAVFFTLIKVKERLKGQPLRFAAVASANVVLVMLIGAWLWGLGLPSKGQTELTIDSETWLAEHQHGAKLLARYPSLEKLSVSGYGFEQHHWQGFVSQNTEQTTGVEVNFTPKHVKAGFANIRWPKTLNLGERLTVQGQWLNPANPLQVVTIDLLDVAGQKVASTRVRHGESIDLNGIVKAPGNFAFVLQANSDDKALGKALDMQKLFVNVSLFGLSSSTKAAYIKQSPLNILVMQSAPSFEVNHLKNWAGSYGAKMLILTDISKERFITQRVNRENEGKGKDVPNQLSQSLLADMDILIMDGRKLAGLTDNHMSMIATAVENGLGLLIFADSDFIDKTPPWLNGKGMSEFSFSPITGVARNQRVLPVVNGLQSEVSFDLISYAFDPSPQLTVLERSHQNRPLTMLKNHGLGKVAVSLFNNRYQWQQQQKHHMYSGAWQHLFKSISRVERVATFLPANPNQINLVNEKMSVCLLSKAPSMQNNKTDDLLLIVNGQPSVLPLTQDSQQNSRYCTWYWPRQSGWHQFRLMSAIGEGKGEIKLLLGQWRYVYDQKSWQTHQQNRRLQDTLSFVATNKQHPKRVAPSYHQVISGPWYWWLLILCVTFLWFESRKRH